MAVPYKNSPAHAGGVFLLPCILTRCMAFVLLGCNTAPRKRLQRVLPCQCNYTANTTKQRTGLYRSVSCNFTRSTAHDTRPTQQAIAPPAPRWSAYTRQNTLHRYQIPPPRWTLYRAAQAAYYNKVYKRAAHASPAGQSSGNGAAGGRNHWRLAAASLFGLSPDS